MVRVPLGAAAMNVSWMWFTSEGVNLVSRTTVLSNLRLFTFTASSWWAAISPTMLVEPRRPPRRARRARAT